MKKNKFLFISLSLSILLAGCDTAFERELAGKKIRLLAPANNTASSDTTQTFYWEPLGGAIGYRLRIVSPRLDSIVRLIEDTTIESNRFTISRMPKGDYQWEVMGVNNSSSTDPSDTWNLKIN